MTMAYEDYNKWTGALTTPESPKFKGCVICTPKSDSCAEAYLQSVCCWVIKNDTLCLPSKNVE